MTSLTDHRLPRAAVPAQLQSKLRLYRRLWISSSDLREAQGTIAEILRSKLPYPRHKEPSPLLAALTTAMSSLTRVRSSTRAGNQSSQTGRFPVRYFAV